MARRKFKDPDQQAIYDWYLENDPGEGHRSKGGRGNAYFVGRFYSSKRPFAQRNSIAYAAWAAGVDLARRASKA